MSNEYNNLVGLILKEFIHYEKLVFCIELIGSLIHDNDRSILE